MRFCDTDEAGELAEMAREIWMDYFPAVVGKEATEYILDKIQSERAIKEQIWEGYLYSFIEDNGIKAGYLCIKPEGDSLFMSKLYVAKDHRGKGLGSKALDDILEKGRSLNMKKVYLRVNRHNAPSMDIYKHKGFVIAREEKIDLGSGFFMDDYLMEYHF